MAAAMAEQAADTAGVADVRLRELVAYWAGLRGDRAAPPRAALDPAGMLALLPWVALLDVQQDGFQLRLAGTALEAICGRSLTGVRLAQPAVDGIDPDLLDWLRHACHARVPLSLQAVVTTRRGPGRLQAVILPLSSDGESVDKLLCGCVPVGGMRSGGALFRRDDPALALTNVTAITLMV
ncbi:PAS domain-containing protein [Niveispirillum irakense]|uniref:PAS domain-containing protein n=1 Tax=Niveispirillum irakense TaxID=34011 RepID=UPI0012B5F17F|nr:PAS domain-containing protein [Niveispirillum irakense]